MNLDLTREGLHRAAARAAELYTEIFAELEQRRVDPGASREQMRSLLGQTIGERGVGLDQALEEFAEWVLPNSMGTPHPMYLGLVNSSPLPAGPLADLLISSLNNNCGGFHQSPAITASEQVVIQQFARLCGLGGEEASGMVLPGGTMANLQGLLLARHARFPEWDERGPQALAGMPLLYTSDATHFCNARAGQVIGIGRAGIATVASRGRGAIDLDQLESQIVRDRREGRLPFAVVGNAGTTGTGAIDDIGGLADLCQRHQLWLHVDACYGGGALLLDPPIQELQQIGRADSIAIDPHKWFFIPLTAGLLLTRHPQLEADTFDIAASYIPRSDVVESCHRGLPTSRRGSAMTIWMALRAHGWGVIREAVARDIRLTRYLERLLRDAGFRLLEGGQLSVACARWQPDGPSAEALDHLQSRIAGRVVDSGRAWFSTVRHDGLTWLRLNLVNLYTTERHIESLADLIEQAAHDCHAP